MFFASPLVLWLFSHEASLLHKPFEGTFDSYSKKFHFFDSQKQVGFLIIEYEIHWYNTKQKRYLQFEFQATDRANEGIQTKTITRQPPRPLDVSEPFRCIRMRYSKQLGVP